MAKTPTSTIKREDENWGTRLSYRPFPASVHLMPMEIVVDIAKPRPGLNADIKTRFSGVPFNSPLGVMDVSGWLNSMHAMQTQAREIADAMKAERPAAAKKSTKKAAKKAAKKTSKKS